MLCESQLLANCDEFTEASGTNLILFQNRKSINWSRVRLRTIRQSVRKRTLHRQIIMANWLRRCHECNFPLGNKDVFCPRCGARQRRDKFALERRVDKR